MFIKVFMIVMLFFALVKEFGVTDKRFENLGTLRYKAVQVLDTFVLKITTVRTFQMSATLHQSTRCKFPDETSARTQ
jgi:hypothetical protein